MITHLVRLVPRSSTRALFVPRALPRFSSSSSSSSSSSNPSSNAAATTTTFSNEWATAPPTPNSQPEGRIEFTIRIPKPIRPINEDIEAKRARLLWSVRKRGILECDLLLSTFVDKDRLKRMSAIELEQLDSLLEENDWDLYYWITQAKPVPEEVKAYGFWEDLVEHSKNKRKDILRMPALKE